MSCNDWESLFEFNNELFVYLSKASLPFDLEFKLLFTLNNC